MKNIILLTCITQIIFCQTTDVTFSKDISPIIYNNCTECHRQGEIGAFLNLTNYSEVYNNRNWI